MNAKDLSRAVEYARRLCKGAGEIDGDDGTLLSRAVLHLSRVPKEVVSAEDWVDQHVLFAGRPMSCSEVRETIIDAIDARDAERAAARAFANPPVDFAEAEQRLLAWLRSSLPSQVEHFERKNTLSRIAEFMSNVTFDFTEGSEFKDDEGKDVTEEIRMRRIDTLATLWLLRRAKEREEAKRHAALILDAVATAADVSPA